MTTLCRFDSSEVRKFLQKGIRHEELIALEREDFDTADNFITAAKQNLTKLHYEFRDGSHRESNRLIKPCFIHLYRKFDTVYHQEHLALQSIYNSEDTISSVQKEAQSKQRIIDVIRCELLIHILDSAGEKVQYLTSLLEVFFDDTDNLDILLLLLAHKFCEATRSASPSLVNIGYFMTSFFKVYGREGFDMLNVWQHRKGSKELISLIDIITEDIKTSLENNTWLSQQEIAVFIEGLKNKSLQQRRKLVRTIWNKKDAFKDQKLYYQVLGSLSMLQFLHCAREEEEQVAVAFLRGGIITYLFVVEYLRYKKEIESIPDIDIFQNFEQFTFSVQLEFPSQVLRYILSRLNQENPTHSHLRTLELLGCIIELLPSNKEGLYELKPMDNNVDEQYYDQYFEGELNGLKESECVWSQFYRFFTSNVNLLIEMEPVYTLRYSVYEEYIWIWATLCEGPLNSPFAKDENANPGPALNSKYLDVIADNAQKLVNLFTKEELQLGKIPYSISKLLIHIVWIEFIGDRRLYKRIDLDILFEKVDREALVYVVNLRNILPEGNSKSLDDKQENYLSVLALDGLSRWLESRDFQTMWIPGFSQEVSKMLEKSQLLRYVLDIYEKEETWISTIKDSVITKALVRSLFPLLEMLIFAGESEWIKGKNTQTKLFFQDMMLLDEYYWQDDECFNNNNKILSLFNAEPLKKWKDWKLVIVYLRYYWFLPDFQSKDCEGVFGYRIRAFVDSEEDAEILFGLIQRFLVKLEEKLKDPSVNFEESIGKLQDEAKREQDQTRSDEDNKVLAVQKVVEDTKILFKIDGNEKVFNGKTSSEELKYLALRCCWHLHIISYQLHDDLKTYYNPDCQLTYELIRQTTRMTFNPYLLFADSGFNLSRIGNYGLWPSFHFNSKATASLCQGIYEGIIDICESFNLLNDTTLSNMNKHHLIKLFIRFANFECIEMEMIPRDVSWAEASLVSLFIALKYLAESTMLRDLTDSFSPSSEVLIQFKKASELLLQLTSKLYRALYISLYDEAKQTGDWKTFSESSLKISRGISSGFKPWQQIWRKFEVSTESESAIEEFCTKAMDRLGSEEREEEVRIACDVSIIKETLYFISEAQKWKEGMCEKVLFNVSTFQKFLNLEKLNISRYCSGSLNQDIKPLVVETSIALRDFRAKNKLDATAIKPRIMEVLAEVNSFVIDLFDMNKVNYQEANVLMDIKDLLMHLQGLYLVGAEHFRNNQEDPTMGESKSKFIEYLKEDLLVSLSFTEMIGFTTLWKDFISKRYWIEEYHKAYKKTLKFICELLDDTDFIKKELNREIEGLEKDLIPDKALSPYNIEHSESPLNNLRNLHVLFSIMKQFFEEEIAGDLKLSSVFIEGLIVAVNSLLKSVFSEGLTRSKKEIENSDVFSIIKHLISNVGEVAIDYIVAHTVNNSGAIDADVKDTKPGTFQHFLVAALELTDLALSVHDYIIQSLEYGILDDKCETVINLMNVILRSNKALRVVFLNKGTLTKLLSMKKFSLSDQRQVGPLLSLFATLVEDEVSVGKLNDIESSVSPIAKKSLSVLLGTLLSNYMSLEASSMDYNNKIQKQKEEHEKRKQSKLKLSDKQKQGIFTDRNDDDVLDDYEEEEKLREKSSKLTTNTPLQDTNLLVLVLSSIFPTYPYLIPYVVFHEADMNALSTKIKQEDAIWQLFNQNRQYTILDVLIRLFLWREGESALFFVGALLSTKDKQPRDDNMTLRCVLLQRIFQIIEEILDLERASGAGLRTFESMQMRFNIAWLLSYISENFISEFLDNGEVHKGIINVTQKLLYDIDTVAWFMERVDVEVQILDIVVNVINQATSTTLNHSKVKKYYVQILKGLEQGYTITTNKNESSSTLKTRFEDFIFRVEEDMNAKEINPQDQKKFETWDDKAQWEKHETRKFMVISNLKEDDKDIVPVFAIPVNRATKISSEHNFEGYRDIVQRSMDELVRFCKVFEVGERRKDFLMFYSKWKSINTVILQQIPEKISQSFGYDMSSQNKKPWILRYKDQKDIEENKKDEDQTQRTQIIAEEKREDKLESGSSQGDDANLLTKYFFNEDVRNERHLKYHVNKVVKQGKRLKEAICLEMTLKTIKEKHTMDLNVDGIIIHFTENMRTFDRNVIYATLGTEIKSRLSESMKKQVEEIEKAFKRMKQDYESYYSRLQKAECTRKEEEFKAEDEASDYDILEDDYRFSREKQNNNSNEVQNEGDIQKENEEFEELIREQNNLTGGGLQNIMDSFRFDDMFLLKLCRLFFARYSTKQRRYSQSPSIISKFFTSGICKNPVNSLKILDALLFILYTPELLEHSLNDNIADFPPHGCILSHEKVSPQTLFQTLASNIISYLRDSMQKKELSYLFLTPAKYLDKFGIDLLAPLKEKTGYKNKISECYSVLDVIVSLLDNPLIRSTGACAVNIIEGVKALLFSEKRILLGKEGPEKVNLENYQLYFSFKSFLTLLRSLLSPLNKIHEPYDQIEDFLSNFKYSPELFITLQDDLNSYILSLVPLTNSVLEDSIKALKTLDSAKCGYEDPQKIMVKLDHGEFQILKTMLGSYMAIFYHFLCTEVKHQEKVSGQIYSLLQNLNKNLFTVNTFQTFLVNIYEVADLFQKAKDALNVVESPIEPSLRNIIEICLYHYSILVIQTSCKNIQGPDEQFKKQEHNGNSPKLSRLAVHDELETIKQAKLQRTFSNYKKFNDIDFNAIFANFAFKYAKTISQMTQILSQSKSNLMSDVFALLVPRCPWMLDLPAKTKLYVKRQ